MANKIKYTVDLTEDEAVALVMLRASGLSPRQGFVAARLVDIAEALAKVDPKLPDAQFRKWESIGSPYFELKDKYFEQTANG